MRPIKRRYDLGRCSSAMIGTPIGEAKLEDCRMTEIAKRDSSSRYWRYQAVRVDYPAYPEDPEYLIIEVCLSRANDRLCSWSAEPASKRPSGDTYAELLDDLMRMLRDAREWKPVAIDDLRIGMQFERLEVKDTARRGFE